jgi:hypothetical protein
MSRVYVSGGTDRLVKAMKTELDATASTLQPRVSASEVRVSDHRRRHVAAEREPQDHFCGSWSAPVSPSSRGNVGSAPASTRRSTSVRHALLAKVLVHVDAPDVRQAISTEKAARFSTTRKRGGRHTIVSSDGAETGRDSRVRARRREGRRSATHARSRHPRRAREDRSREAATPRTHAGSSGASFGTKFSEEVRSTTKRMGRRQRRHHNWLANTA